MKFKTLMAQCQDFPNLSNMQKNGECVIVVDDERRENEGDLICAAQFATPQQINFMATEGRGCLLYTSDAADE